MVENLTTPMKWQKIAEKSTNPKVGWLAKRILLIVLSKVHYTFKSKIEYFFQTPKPVYQYCALVWCTRHRKKQWGTSWSKFASTITSVVYTSHWVRATSVSVLDNCVIEARSENSNTTLENEAKNARRASELLSFARANMWVEWAVSYLDHHIGSKKQYHHKNYLER